MHILAVASECFPLVKTGGLADVVGALPGALSLQGHDVQTLLPGYTQAMERLEPGVETVDRYDELYGGPARVLRGRAMGSGIEVVVVDAPHLFARAGQPYVAPDGNEWWDNGFRFAALCVVARELSLGRVEGYRPDVLHAHDWQGGLAPAYLAFDGRRPRPATVMTVHNLAFQGQMPPDWLAGLGLPPWSFQIDGVGLLKAGLRYADQVTTVSPTYAQEIQGDLWGMGMQGLLADRADDLTGIVNGLDTTVWDPAADTWITPGYDGDSLNVRLDHKRTLQRQLELDPNAGGPLFCVVSRLTWQKGMDLLLDAVPAIVDADAQLAVLGSGEAGIERGLSEAMAAHPGRVACRFGYDEPLAHQLMAGGDAILVPSRFEPCGLVQLQGLRYGCVPVVARTGGLVDTVRDLDEVSHAPTGFLFQAGDAAALDATIGRVAGVYAEPGRWRALQRTGLAEDLGWARAAERYVAVYERARARLG